MPEGVGEPGTRGDLEQYAIQAARDVAGPLGIVFLRAALLATRSDQQPSRQGYMSRRGTQLQAMLDRAAARGETPPTLVDRLLTLTNLRQAKATTPST